jgi:hypothetical protein
MVVGSYFTTMHLSTLQLVLWLCPTVLEVAILVSIVHRRLWRTLPIFASYLVFEIGRTAFLFLQRSNDANYFWAYWATEALGSFAAFCVIKELFDNAFQRQLGIRKLGNVLFEWSVAILFVTAVLIAWASPGNDIKKLMASILVLKRTATIVEAGLLGFLFFFVFAFGISWQHYAIGVFLGFGLYGSVEIVAITSRAIYGPVATGVFNWVVMTANNCCVLVWAIYFLARAPVEAKSVPVDAANRLRELDEALLALLKV